jgi:predicted SnoaL-like aldol condensation-catalyzing enzyme
MTHKSVRRPRRGPSEVFSILALSACAACSGDGGASASNRPSPAPPEQRVMNALPTGAAATNATPPASNASAAPGTSEMPTVSGGNAAAPDEGAPAALPLDNAPADDSSAATDVPLPACARDISEANQATVAAAIDALFVQGDISAVDRYWGEPYLQHNPIAASGVTAFRNLFSGLITPGRSIYDRSRILAECELVLIHGSYTSFGGPTFDLFRVDGGRLVEHWDAAATGAGPNGSGHTALDGDATVRDLELSAQNEALVLRFVERVLIQATTSAIGEYLSPTLIEHDPESSDGSDAYLQHLQERAISYRQVHHSIGDGNFVFVLSEGAVAAQDVAHYDLFRVDGSRLVEHWNARRAVPATTQSGLGIF